MWKKFKHDFVERFLNFETAKGIYMVPAGIILTYMAIFHIAFIIQTAAGLLGWYTTSEGLRKIFVNRVKQKVKFEERVRKRKAPDVA